MDKIQQFIVGQANFDLANTRYVPQKIGAGEIHGIAIGAGSEIDAICVADGHKYTNEKPLIVAVGCPHAGDIDADAWWWPAKNFLSFSGTIAGLSARVEIVTFNDGLAAVGYTQRNRYTKMVTAAAASVSSQVPPFWICGRKKIRFYLFPDPTTGTTNNYSIDVAASCHAPSSLSPGGVDPSATAGLPNVKATVVFPAAASPCGSAEFPLIAGTPSGGFDMLVFSNFQYDNGTAAGNVSILVEAED